MRIRRKILRNTLVALTLVLFALLCVSPSVAKEKKAAGGEEITILSSLPLNGMAVNQMFLQQYGDKIYLYLHRPAEDSYALVDVTNPSKPTLLDANALKGGTAEGPAGNSPVAITATQEGGGKSQAPAELLKQTINFVDTSDPKAPKVVKTFKGVTSMYSDDSRKLVYVVNDEGLAIVRHRGPATLCGADSKNPGCPAGVTY